MSPLLGLANVFNFTTFKSTYFSYLRGSAKVSGHTTFLDRALVLNRYVIFISNGFYRAGITQLRNLSCHRLEKIGTMKKILLEGPVRVRTACRNAQIKGEKTVMHESTLLAPALQIEVISFVFPFAIALSSSASKTSLKKRICK